MQVFRMMSVFLWVVNSIVFIYLYYTNDMWLLSWGAMWATIIMYSFNLRSDS